MLQSQDNEPFGERQLTGREVEVLCQHVQARACANFQFAESVLVSHCFTHDRDSILSEGRVASKRLVINPAAFASALRWDESEFHEALTSLQAGDVLRRDEDGLWQLNPDWREWKYSDGRKRIGPEFRGFMEMKATKWKPKIHRGR
jgi:hypothetical protein